MDGTGQTGVKGMDDPQQFYRFFDITDRGAHQGLLSGPRTPLVSRGEAFQQVG